MRKETTRLGDDALSRAAAAAVLSVDGDLLLGEGRSDDDGLGGEGIHCSGLDELGESERVRAERRRRLLE